MKNTKQKITFLMMIMILNSYLMPLVKANSNFTIGLELGTQVYEVDHYDEISWKNTINSSSDPSQWFGGEANIVGAKSKVIIQSWNSDDYSTISIFRLLLFTNKTSSLFLIVSDYGYGEEYIIQNYPYYYYVWDYVIYIWPFTSGEFDIYNNAGRGSIILQNPQDIKQILDNYNDYVNNLNNDTILQALNISFPILNGENLIWQLILNRFVIGNPVNDYLSTFTEILGCENITIQGNILKYHRCGAENYTTEMIFNSNGIIEIFMVKDSEGYIIYKISSSSSKTLVYIIFGIMGISILGIVVIFTLRKIQLKKAVKSY